jgi:preprotein translocase subunit SecA
MPAVSVTSSVYPEREDGRTGKLQKLFNAAQYYTGKMAAGSRRLSRIVEATHRHSAGLDAISDAELRARASALRPKLRAQGFTEIELAAQAFALTREAAWRTNRMRHFDVQMIGAWAMVNGMLAEMETGEGKTLTATLAAATAALAGQAVHVVTVNDYLAERDSETMRPLYELLGLKVSCVMQGMEPDIRRAAYNCDITYCSNKEIAFDYLRDRMVLGGKPRAIAMRMAALDGAGVGRRLLLRGLQFAIVDEADSVLIDEARTPLILSSESKRGTEQLIHRQALELSLQLGEEHYRVGENGVAITKKGEDKLEALCAQMAGIWRGPRRRLQLVQQALTAQHVFKRDKHYLVRDGKVMIIDEYTGRLMPDRSWEQGLHQLIEMKEECETTGQRETLARISYQRFFRRYLHLSGMTGTASEVARELWLVYRLRVSRIPTNRPIQRRYLPAQYFGQVEAKLQAVIDSVVKHSAAGRPVLVGTRSVAASENLAALMDKKGMSYRILNARQDKHEAEIVARAGEPGAITVATNMAGRGTDIKLGPGIAERGGLHVIATDLHESARIDRQLYGRCGRQGDPGSCEAILASDEDLVTAFFAFAPKRLKRFKRLPRWLGAFVFRVSQWRAESSHSKARRELLDMDEYLGDVLAFSGRGE